MDYRQQEKMQAMASAQVGQAGNSLGWQSGLQAANVPTPSEPGLRQRLTETLSYLSELATVHGQIRLALAGPEPINSLDNAKQPGEPSIEYLASMVCQYTAMAVSEARTIQNRL